MKRNLTKEELIALGLDEEQANLVIEAQEQPKPRVFRFVCKCTQEVADQVNEQFPELNLSRAKWAKE